MALTRQGAFAVVVLLVLVVLVAHVFASERAAAEADSIRRGGAGQPLGLAHYIVTCAARP